VKDLKQWSAVQELQKRKVSKQQIAKQLEMSRNAVKRLIKLKEDYHRYEVWRCAFV